MLVFNIMDIITADYEELCKACREFDSLMVEVNGERTHWFYYAAEGVKIIIA
jgi:hypothetical protein